MKASFERWKFAAFYNFPEMEKYCRHDPSCWGKIAEILKDSMKSVEYLVRDCQLSLELVGGLVTAIISNQATEIEVLYQRAYPQVDVDSQA
jgi:hypothetical protein